MTTERLKILFEKNARGAMARIRVDSKTATITIRATYWIHFMMADVVERERVMGVCVKWRPLRLWDFWILRRKNLLVLVEV